MNHSTYYDVIIIGGGAAGLFCAIEAGKRHKKVLVIESEKKIGKKILISGGGRCNFTNIGADPERYISQNIHFCKSALSQYTPHDFIALIEKYDIPYREKTLGQLFGIETARVIVAMLRRECEENNVEIITNTKVLDIIKSGKTLKSSSCTENSESHFSLKTRDKEFSTASLVIATGGISIPKMGATPFGYNIAKQFGISVTKRKPGLVPLVFDKTFLKNFQELSGVSLHAEVSYKSMSFRENILITHRGISGPAILQISSYWNTGDTISINLLPDYNVREIINEQKNINGRKTVKGLLTPHLPKSFLQVLFSLPSLSDFSNKPVAELSNSERDKISDLIHCWEIKPSGSEGYRTAEVTVGGICTSELSSKTFESKKVSGLFFIGEVVDVTGWLGGYNFQWAWSSGYCAGQYV